MLVWIRQYAGFALPLKRLLLIGIAVFLMAQFFGVDVTHAQNVVAGEASDFGAQTVDDTLVLAGGDIRVIVARIINAVLALLGILTVGIMLYGGFIYMTSGGAEDKIAQAKKIIINGVIGLVIITSAFAIVQFVLRALMDATGSGLFGRGGADVQFETFAGSGALGDIVEDHYPFRFDTNVPRNTRIVVTFAFPVKPQSFIENTNNTCWAEDGSSTDQCEQDGEGNIVNPAYGDCFAPGGGPIDAAQHCDRLNTEAVQIYKVADQLAQEENPDVELPLVDAAAMVAYENVNGVQRDARTFVLKPIEFLGSNNEDIAYIVDLTQQIEQQEGDGVSAFANDRDGHYFWQFETGTEFDFTPPHIESHYPAEGELGFRNDILQIHFSEPVDPTVVQGASGPASIFHHLIFGDQNVTGQWIVSNRYRTVEFLSSEVCGTNSCGDDMYCLPVPDCPEGEENCLQQYELLARTAEKVNPGAFEAYPFSGIQDMAGNALDGRTSQVTTTPDGIAQEKPAIGNNHKLITPEQRAADNYWWQFRIRNEIDRRVPNIVDMRPYLDQGAVEGDAPVTANFSLRMWYSSLRNIDVEESAGQPRAGRVLPPEVLDLRPMWTRVRASTTLPTPQTPTATQAIVDHRVFGPNNTDMYYFAAVPSEVKAVNQNCMYPGWGPWYGADQAVAAEANGNPPRCQVQYLPNGQVVAGENCAPVRVEGGNNDTGCINTRLGENEQTTSSVSACLQRLNQASVRVFDVEEEVEEEEEEENEG